LPNRSNCFLQNYELWTLPFLPTSLELYKFGSSLHIWNFPCLTNRAQVQICRLKGFCDVKHNVQLEGFWRIV
jgi:hypothetical protein